MSVIRLSKELKALSAVAARVCYLNRIWPGPISLGMRVTGLYERQSGIGNSCVNNRYEPSQARRGFDIDRKIKVHTSDAWHLRSP